MASTAWHRESSKFASPTRLQMVADKYKLHRISSFDLAGSQVTWYLSSFVLLAAGTFSCAPEKLDTLLDCYR